jgi:general secretion pathway protein A
LPGHARYWLRRYGRWAAAALVLIAIGMAVPMWMERSAQPPVAAAVATPAPAPVDALAPVRDRIAHVADGDLGAWTQLLARWQVNSTQVTVRDAARCQAVIAAGINCLHGSGTIEQLARFDRPLILVLQQGEARANALLQDVDAQHVRLDFGGRNAVITKAELALVWNGEFMAIWRLPAELPATLHQGDAGPGVAWVKAQLARMDGGKSAEAGPAFFDPTVEERVRKLQLAYGIKPDGIVGPETLFALSSLDEGGPHLFRSIE